MKKKKVTIKISKRGYRTLKYYAKTLNISTKKYIQLALAIGLGDGDIIIKDFYHNPNSTTPGIYFVDHQLVIKSWDSFLRTMIKRYIKREKERKGKAKKSNKK